MKKTSYPVYKADRNFFSKIRSEQQFAYVSQSRSEEMFNMLTHALGLFLAVIGTFTLIFFSARSHNNIKIATTLVYGFSLIFMYAASTLYHGTTEKKLKKFFHTLDHSAIFILIAGTNTPILLLYLRSDWGLELFLAAWVLAFTGVFLELMYADKIPKYISLTLYSLMGWMILLAAKPMFRTVPAGLLHWLFLGGVTFMLGIYFYAKKNLYFNHVIWHLIVLTGTVFHYIGMLYYVAMGRG